MSKGSNYWEGVLESLVGIPAINSRDTQIARITCMVSAIDSVVLPVKNCDFLSSQVSLIIEYQNSMDTVFVRPMIIYIDYGYSKEYAYSTSF